MSLFLRSMLAAAPPTLKFTGTGWRSHIRCQYPSGILMCVSIVRYVMYLAADSRPDYIRMEYVHGVYSCRQIGLRCSRAALDYPPFFAYFEKVLSIPAYFIDPKIVDLHNLNYDSWSVIAYQRTSVILTELVLGVAVQRYALSIERPASIGAGILTIARRSQIHSWIHRSRNSAHHLRLVISTPGVPHRGSHTLSVQRLYVWYPAVVHLDGTKCTLQNDLILLTFRHR